MAEAYGKLRSDLEIQPEQNSGVVVKDPITNRFYRFPSVQASVLEHLDGSRDYDSIAAAVSSKHQVEALPEQIREFTEKLQNLLLLDHPFCWEQLKSVQKGDHGRLGNLLHLKLRTFQPDRLITALEKRFRFFFTASFQLLYGLLFMIALVISIQHGKFLFMSLADMFSLYSIPLILIVLAAVITIHEFAHGITLKHYGGKVGEMGVMLFYFMPAFYCNVSDAWMLKKRERIFVSLAGGYIQIFLWAVSTILWRLLAPETFASRICLLSIMFNGVFSLFNFNPLIRLDGYYMLSDILEVPNLRSKSLSYLKHAWYSLLAGTENSQKKNLDRREKRILLSYGTASCLFTMGLVTYMVYLIGGWMVREYQTWGVIMTSMLLAMMVPVVRLKVNESGSFTKALMNRFRKSPKFLIFLLFIILCGFLPWELKISGDFIIVPIQNDSITAEVEGTIKEIYVDEGDHVSAGQAVAKMENLDLDESYQVAMDDLDIERANLELLKSDPLPEEIDEANTRVATRQTAYNNATQIEKDRDLKLTNIAKKEAEVESARIEYERYQKAWKDGVASESDANAYRMKYEVLKQELIQEQDKLSIFDEESKQDIDLRKKELDEAVSARRVLMADPSPETIREAESRIEKLENKIQNLKNQIEHLVLRSKIEGIVETPRLQDRKNAYLGKGDLFCKIASTGTVRIEMPIPEKETDEIREGLPIILKIRPFPHRLYEAHVLKTSQVAADDGSVTTITVYGELENPDGSLKANMTGVGKILCGKRMIINLATRRAIRWLRTEFWEYLP